MSQHISNFWQRGKMGRSHGDWVWFLGIVLLVLLAIGRLGIESMCPTSVAQHKNFLAVAHWFDPVFFQYNLIMVMLMVLIVPLLVFSYIGLMIGRKKRRLIREIKEWEEAEEREDTKANSEARERYIADRIGHRATFSAYAGSIILTMMVVALGASILLLFKPTPLADGIGVHFSLGANVLMMGPFIELFEKNPDAYYVHLTRSMTAFQFGFLGAYVYFIVSLARAYLTLDLTHHTLVDGTIRMIVASVLALVLSFGFYGDLKSVTPLVTTVSSDMAVTAVKAASGVNPASNVVAVSSPRNASTVVAVPPVEAVSAVKTVPGAKAVPQAVSNEGSTQAAALPMGLAWLPVISFFFGFYPKRALLVIENVSRTLLVKSFPEDSYRAQPLSGLAGISYAHELRLEREGLDNIENLSNANAVDLAVSTSFSYKQLMQWIGEAWLMAHLREDFPTFVQRTGMTSRTELKQFFSAYGSDTAKAVEQLIAGLTTNSTPEVAWRAKLNTLGVLLNDVALPRAEK